MQINNILKLCVLPSYNPAVIFIVKSQVQYLSLYNAIILSNIQTTEMEPNCDLSFLQCYICFQSLKKPKMCPSCSKVACQKCLRQWVEDHRPECPHCRKVMPLNNFAECQRFINDIKHLISALDRSDKVKQKCEQHKIQMQYYCQDCKIAICSDCGMFGVKHKGHNITHLNKIYQAHKNKILNELTRFDHKIENYRKNGYQIKLQMQRLHIQMEQKKNFVEEYFVAILDRLKQQFKQKQDLIAKKYDGNMKQIQFLESVRQNLCQDLQGHSENQLIKKCEEFVSYIKVLCDKGAQYQFEDHSFDTIHEMVPKYNQFKYTLEDYLNLEDGIIYSDPYTVNGIQWRLKIYPRGNGHAKETHMSVFLQMSKGYVNENKYEYKIQLINQKYLKDSIVREYSSNFDIGQCWGYNQFIPIEEVENDFLTEEGGLVFHISVRNPSYRSLVRDQNNYIQMLQTKIEKENEKKKSLKKVKSSQKMNELQQEVKLRKQSIQKLLLQNSHDHHYMENSYEMEEEQAVKMQLSQDLIIPRRQNRDDSKLSYSLIELLQNEGDREEKLKLMKNLSLNFQIEKENQ